MAKFFAISVDELLGIVPFKDRWDDLSAKEKQLVAKYRALSARGKARTLEQLDFEIALESRSPVDERDVFRVAEDAVLYENTHA